MSDAPGERCARHERRMPAKRCRACYQRRRYRKMSLAACHPTRREHCGGLCRSCYRQGGRAARATCHPERLQAARGLCRACYNREPEILARAARARRRRKYKLRAKRFAALVARDGAGCPICGSRATCIDHCHKTGRVRGLLCIRCNTALGQLKDDIRLLAAAIAYLKRGDKGLRKGRAA